MNSLLQSLHMTPEFRRALYKWKYDSEKEPKKEDCIPLQLQKLFGSADEFRIRKLANFNNLGRLQLSKESCIPTEDLTHSFGWSQTDAFQQHDVQELCRILFDALEVFAFTCLYKKTEPCI